MILSTIVIFQQKTSNLYPTKSSPNSKPNLEEDDKRKIWKWNKKKQLWIWVIIHWTLFLL